MNRFSEAEIQAMTEQEAKLRDALCEAAIDVVDAELDGRPTGYLTRVMHDRAAALRNFYEGD